MRLLFTIIFLFSITALASDKEIAPDNLFPKVKLETTMGIIIVELDRVKAPITVNNFLTYVVNKAYDNTVFHRVIENFIVQGGGYDIDFTLQAVNENIINESGNGLKNETATIAMAKESRPHSANRQFFFNVADNKSLDPGKKWGYAVFGAIVEGEEVLEKMSVVKTDYDESMGWEDVPVEPIILMHATLLPEGS